MEKFQVIRPSALLAAYVKQYWFLTLEDVKPGSQRFVPNGCTLLTFHRCGQIRSSVSGQQTVFTDLVYSGDIDFISIVFQPAGAMAVFNIPAIELNNQNIPIEALDDPQVAELEEQLGNLPDAGSCVRLIENFLLRRIYQFEGCYYKRLESAVRSVCDGQYDISILAQTACFGERQFRRVFSEYIGLNPKDFIRITRYQKASHILQIRPRIPLTQLAYECAYYDKSHLIREFKEFSGYTPQKFVLACDPYSEYHSLFRSALVDIKQ